MCRPSAAEQQPGSLARIVTSNAQVILLPFSMHKCVRQLARCCRAATSQPCTHPHTQNTYKQMSPLPFSCTGARQLTRCCGAATRSLARILTNKTHTSKWFPCLFHAQVCKAVGLVLRGSNLAALHASLQTKHTQSSESPAFFMHRCARRLVWCCGAQQSSNRQKHLQRRLRLKQVNCGCAHSSAG